MMKKLLLILLCFPMIGFGQDASIFNQFKYIYLPPLKYQNGGIDIFGINTKAEKELKYYGFNVISDWNIPEEVSINSCLAIACIISHPSPKPAAGFGGWNRVNIVFKDCQENIIYSTSGSYNRGFSVSHDFAVATKKALEFFNGYKYKYDESANTLNPKWATQKIPFGEKKSNISNNTNNEWKGNGSGFFISRSGYIVTNYHVIDGASDIEVEFKYKNQVVGFNAKVVKVDKTNDLAIIKIDDSEFSNLSDIPYNFKTRSVDVGTEIFALGYPMALSLMGKDIKFTDGKISSKTGLGGDITTYQIQVPIQPGNSGGPLFDTKGNLIGITSSGVNRKLDITENVNYAIKSSYLLNLIDVLPETITLPSSTQLSSKPLTEQIKILSDYVVLIKVK